MTVELEPDPEATAEIPQLPNVDEDAGEELEEFDPEKTLVREDWESIVIRRVAPHVVAVQSEVAELPGGEDRYGWEAEGLRRLSMKVREVTSETNE